MQLNPSRFKVIAAFSIFNVNRSCQVGVCIICVDINGLLEVAGLKLFAHLV